MAEEERLHHMADIGVVAPLHEIGERARRSDGAGGDVERGEGEQRRTGEVARHEETAGRQARQRHVIGAAAGEVGSKQLRRLQGLQFIARSEGIEARKMGVPMTREGETRRLAAGGDGRHRPLGIGEGKKRQIEQPFARIVDDIEGQLARHPVARKQALAPIFDGEPELGKPPRALRPVAVVGGERGEVALVGEAGQGIVGLGFEVGARHAALGVGRQQRQPAAVNEIVHQRRYEDRLAGPRQPGDAEAQGRRHQPFGEVPDAAERDASLIDEGCSCHVVRGPGAIVGPGTTWTQGLGARTTMAAKLLYYIHGVSPTSIYPMPTPKSACRGDRGAIAPEHPDQANPSVRCRGCACRKRSEDNPIWS